MILRKRHAVLSTLTLAAALVLAGCGGDEGSAPPEETSATSSESAQPTTTRSPSTEPTGTESASTEPTAADPTDTDTDSPEPAESPSGTADPGNASGDDPAAMPEDPAAPAPGGGAASVEACRAHDLTGAVTPQEGAAGATILSLTLTNDGQQACHLYGYPGVSFADESGAMIGLPAERAGSAGTPLTVLPGESASASLKQSNAADYGQVCNAHTSAALVVYPPDSYDALSIPYQTQACGNPKIAQLEIQGFGG
ncbi:DUF4232 domain-containing protein [Kocuria coralli]|uniref:DUF4232 domain-containing protein n=1 Tax=Kocuria coralli TaxID=1461025 RepID=A0A5J5L337_9MICC|nr:DUF4232 domain-containing protein [Kocuria coralli]KAA9395421.1 DUF4232 domain-containing protein [Kocuria coralli]